MRTSIYLALAVAVSSGCSYPCPAECEALASTIANQGHNADTGGSGGMDEETVCDIDAVQNATTCRECEDAIRETYRLFHVGITCDCPEDSYFAGEESFITYWDDECVPHAADVTYEGCAEYNNERTRELGMCFE